MLLRRNGEGLAIDAGGKMAALLLE